MKITVSQAADGSYSLADKCDPDFHLSHIAPDGKKSLLYCNNILEI